MSQDTDQAQTPPSSTATRKPPPRAVRQAGAAPYGGARSVVPPASVPLGFLMASGVGLTAFGLATWFAADNAVVAPTLEGVVSAVHLGVLAFLTIAVLGAMHQFAPVVGRAKLRSTAAARVTFVCMLTAAWLVPTGFAHGPDSLITTGGVFGAVAVVIAIWNLSAPLAARDGGVPIAGLRLSVAYLAVTVAFGVVYAFDLQEGWFPLYAHRILAHAHLGLLGWLGLTYIAVAEKLWPMFLLSHRARADLGAWAVGLVAGGVAPLATGLLFGWKPLAVVGAVIVAGGLAAHLASLHSAVRHRRRPLELLHFFLFASAGFLVAAVILGAVAGLADIDPVHRSRFTSAEVAALIGWLGMAVIGHAHKVVPFIAYSTLRAQGIKTNRGGSPLLFGDLFDGRVAIATWLAGLAGFATAVSALSVGSASILAVAGVLLALTGVLVTANLTAGPLRARRTAPVAAAVAPAGPDPGRTP